MGRRPVTLCVAFTVSVVPAGFSASRARATAAPLAAGVQVEAPPAGCGAAVLAPLESAVTGALDRLLGDLGTAGASTSPPTRITVRLANGDLLRLTLSGSRVALSGTALREACQSALRVHSSLRLTWSFTATSTALEALKLTGLPPTPTVELKCSGKGCPFAAHSFTPSGATLDLVAPFATRTLSPGDTVTVEISSPDLIGKVAIFTIESGRQPHEHILCLDPGLTRPVAC